MELHGGTGRHLPSSNAVCRGAPDAVEALPVLDEEAAGGGAAEALGQP